MHRCVSELRVYALLGLAALWASGCASPSMLAFNGPEEEEAARYDGDEDPFADAAEDGDGTAGDDDDAAGSDDDDAEPPSDPSEIVALDPAPDSVDHHYRTPIVITFAGEALGATVSLYDSSGYELPILNRWNEDGTKLTAEPAQWLVPGAPYTVSLDVGEASLEYGFHVSAVGTPLESGAAVDGAAYAIDFSTAESGASPALAALLGTLSSEAAWLWQVDLDSTSQAFSVTAGLGSWDDDGDELSQDLCTATEVLATTESPVELADPYFSSAPAWTTLHVDGVPLHFEEGWFDGDFTPDGLAMVEVGFYGWLRAESVEPLSGRGEACGWLNELLGVTCEECPSYDGQCAWIEVTSMQADSTTVAVTEVDDVDADGCGDEPLALLNCSAAGGGSASLLALLLGLIGLVARAGSRPGSR